MQSVLSKTYLAGAQCFTGNEMDHMPPTKASHNVPDRIETFQTTGESELSPHAQEIAHGNDRNEGENAKSLRMQLNPQKYVRPHYANSTDWGGLHSMGEFCTTLAQLEHQWNQRTQTSKCTVMQKPRSKKIERKTKLSK
ncbi:hypothetical protein M758_UG032800 [Ceratodon purpureus]|nr:hypothetical protein M758_UG032800 [Ceratodon purpureus]